MTLGVYVLVDAADQALYVGSSRDVARRVREHRNKPWWSLVADVEVYAQPDWELAKFVERGLIRRLSPEFNRQSVDTSQHLRNLLFAPIWRTFSEAAQ